MNNIYICHCATFTVIVGPPHSLTCSTMPDVSDLQNGSMKSKAPAKVIPIVTITDL